MYNFSLQYQHTVKQTGIESKENYQLDTIVLIKHQILRTNIKENVWQSERRINSYIVEVKGLTKTSHQTK